MTVLDEVTTGTTIEGDKREILRQAFWLFYHNNLRYAIKIKVWFISVNVTIEQLRPVFELLFGPDPIKT